MQNARLRGPLSLRTRDRAVTAEDYEVLAREVAPEVARVRCVPAEDAAGRCGCSSCRASSPTSTGGWRTTTSAGRRWSCMGRIGSHLDQRRLVGTRLVVEPPAYLGVTVVARVTAEPGRGADEVQDAAMRALYEYLSPLTGGPDGDGWPFGRTRALVRHLRRADPGAGRGARRGPAAVPRRPADRAAAQPAARIDLPPYALVFSYQHQVRVEP